MSSLRRIAIVLGSLVAGMAILVVAGLVWWNLDTGGGRYPDYRLDLDLTSGAAESGLFTAGAARASITPPVPDRWEDVNRNHRFDERVDRWIDGNHNGRFDAIWLAGFHHARAAAGIHDDLWARAVVFGYPGCRVAICAVDLVGLFEDDVIAIRELVNEELAGLPKSISYVIVAATHTHSGPDVMGIWGPSEMESGVNEAYLGRVRAIVVRTIIEAARAAEPAQVVFAAGSTGTDGFVRDSRPPVIIDDTVAVARFVRRSTDETIATLVNWSNHPEALTSGNLLVTSDFPGYLRDAVEHGMPAARGRPARLGLGGMCIYLSGSVGGLMTPIGVRVPDHINADTSYTTPTFAKAEALGRNVAAHVLDLVASATAPLDAPPISVRARTIFIPLANRLFRAAGKIGVIPRAFADGEVRSEVAVLRVGPSSWTCIPGEMYPEIVVGGVQHPHGADFAEAPGETPPIRALMPGGPKFILGLANDEIGYIIPKSQWDEAKPFAYDLDRPPYGEVNSVGPDAAPAIHQAIRTLWSRPAQGVAPAE